MELKAKDLNIMHSKLEDLPIYKDKEYYMGRIMGYLESKVFGPDDTVWTKSRLKKVFEQIDQAFYSFKCGNGHYSGSEQTFKNYLYRRYPLKPNRQVMIYRMRIADMFSWMGQEETNAHKFLSQLHQSFKDYQGFMSMQIKEFFKTIKDGEE